MNRLFHQMLMVSTGTLFVTGVNGVVLHLTGTDIIFAWYYPLSIILLGFLCTLPTQLFILNEWGKEEHFIRNLILHCLLEWIIVSNVGWVSKWYSTWRQLLIITIEYIIVYIFVWSASLWTLKVEDKKINQALKNIQDDEEQ